MRPTSLLLALTLGLVAISFLVVVLTDVAGTVLPVLWGGLVALALADILLSRPRRHLQTSLATPATAYTGGQTAAALTVSVERGALPKGIVAQLDQSHELGPGRFPHTAYGATDNTLRLQAQFDLALRGTFEIRALALKWLSRMGLFEIIGNEKLDRSIAVIPNIAPVLSGQIDVQMLPVLDGMKDMQLRGQGSEFHQLRDFVQGMDPRAIDWKRSAKARALVGRETRAERNHQIVLCIDNGYLMRERIGGLPKIDRAINAALALAWAGGLGGDLVGLYSFDSRPRLFVPPGPGRAMFPRLRAYTAAMQYSSVETNHTLAMTHLHGRLKRRSLVVVFSDFVDSTSAELLVENMGVLARHHVLLYVALRDPLLDETAHPTDITLNNIAKSVSATQILQERQMVIDRLSRLGVICLDVSPQNLTPALVSRYIDIKSRELV
jgi:uncharacterized protein (DUF58 family)